MKLKIIGLPGARVQQALLNAQAAAAGFEQKPKVHWVNDIHEIIGMGRLSIPTVMVNEKRKTSGRVPSVYEITTWIEEELGEHMVA
jgi:hypothetical protein